MPENYQPRHERDPRGRPVLFQWLTPAVRGWLYTVLTAAIPLLIVYGIIEDTHAPLWVALAGAVLGTSTAALHTPAPEERN